jgi:DnaJ-class molecular chaperone
MKARTINMKEIINQVNNFIELEYKLNFSNYSLSDNEWNKIYDEFKKKYLTEKTENRYFKIGTKTITNEKLLSLKSKIFKRKIYLIKTFSKENTKWVNVFCSWSDEYDNIRDCLIFKIINNKIKLYNIETICEICFGTGYIENKGNDCYNCFGTGFSFNSKSKFVNWNTDTNEIKILEQCILLNLPDSEIQKEVLKRNY